MNIWDKFYSLYTEENIGMPLRVCIGKDKDQNFKYIYGRYYGHGYKGNSNIDDWDYQVISMITPDGTIYNDLFNSFREINNENEEDLEKLKHFETFHEKPYHPFFNIVDNHYEKTNEEKIKPVTLNGILCHPRIKDFLEIDLNMFAKALSDLLSTYYGKRYFYNKISFNYKGKTIPYINYNNIKDFRYLFLLSTEQYPKSITKLFSKFTYQERDYHDTMFKQEPLSVKEDEYLINFGFENNPKIKLAEITEDECLVPKLSPYNDWAHNDEITHNNEKFTIIKDFINEIIDYKLENKKLNLEQEDMNIILEKYGISFNSEIHKLITVLNETKEKAIDTALRTNQVGKVLSLKK